MNKQEIDIKRRVVSDLEKKFHKKHEFLSSQYHRNALLSLSFQLLDIKFFAINMLHVILICRRLLIDFSRVLCTHFKDHSAKISGKK